MRVLLTEMDVIDGIVVHQIQEPMFVVIWVLILIAQIDRVFYLRSVGD